ncbi:hypothetical protein M9H77_23894 [Catharanthus roseus]|uniref:Uncharacterized protein n=1 Tax=Catharanthus roseus TaxID=4058 RepID=A0ACC0AV02_CATRO|nr:hypothetical protein M9H77_23894 [Catharanthus roseus]
MKLGGFCGNGWWKLPKAVSDAYISKKYPKYPQESPQSDVRAQSYAPSKFSTIRDNFFAPKLVRITFSTIPLRLSLRELSKRVVVHVKRTSDRKVIHVSSVNVIIMYGMKRYRKEYEENQEGYDHGVQTHDVYNFGAHGESIVKRRLMDNGDIAGREIDRKNGGGDLVSKPDGYGRTLVVMKNLDSQGLGGVLIHQRERLFHT